jgi:glyceraldehyde 3-phosphate dehydrogenase
MKGFLSYTEDEIVSSDVVGNPFSCVFDIKASMALNDTFYKLVMWTGWNISISNSR